VARILDLDLDFFLNHVSHRHQKGRLPSGGYQPWSDDAVRAFLENQCGLSRERRIPGHYAEKHDGAFVWWRSLIEAGRLQPPFDIVHVDAHADLGMAVGGWEYLMLDILHKPVDQRATPVAGDRGLNEGNYLLFAIACRWVKTLTYVHHPESGEGEYIPYTFRDNEPSSNQIQLKAGSPESVRDMLALRRHDFDAVNIEPLVPFLRVPGNQFRADDPIDLIFLCQSPMYTPHESDRLLPVIREYLNET